MEKRAKVEAKLITRKIYRLKVSKEDKTIYTMFFLPVVFTKEDNMISKYYDKLNTKVKKVKQKGFLIDVSDIMNAIKAAMEEEGEELFFYIDID